MFKKLILVSLAAFALLAVSCVEKDGPSGSDGNFSKSDLVGKWGFDNTTTFELKSDGTYVDSRPLGEEVTEQGKWSFADGKLVCTPKEGEAWDAKVVLTGGKAWMVFVYEYEEGGKAGRSFENFRKIGAKVESGTLTDGRWEATNSGIRPAEFTKSTDYIFCMLIKGQQVDLYVPMWGDHIQGTFTLSDGKMHIETDNDHIWKACYHEGNDEEGYIGWQAWGPPGDEADYPNWDNSYGSMNAETFALQSPYTWRTITQILAMGEKPRPGDPTYENNKYMFKYMVYEYGDNERENAMDLCDFDLCIASNGKEGYGGAVGRAGWFYKR